MRLNYELVAPSDLDEEQRKQIGNLDMDIGGLKGALDDDDVKAITGFAGAYLFRGGRLYIGRVDTTQSGEAVALQIVAHLNAAGHTITV